jgi:hypothetical protein
MFRKSCVVNGSDIRFGWCLVRMGRKESGCAASRKSRREPESVYPSARGSAFHSPSLRRVRSPAATRFRPDMESSGRRLALIFQWNGIEREQRPRYRLCLHFRLCRCRLQSDMGSYGERSVKGGPDADHLYPTSPLPRRRRLRESGSVPGGTTVLARTRAMGLSPTSAITRRAAATPPYRFASAEPLRNTRGGGVFSPLA